MIGNDKISPLPSRTVFGRMCTASSAQAMSTAAANVDKAGVPTFRANPLIRSSLRSFRPSQSLRQSSISSRARRAAIV